MSDAEEKFADKLDRMLFEGEFDPGDEGDRELLEFANELKGLMPPVEANRSFKSSLRAELIVAANQRVGMRPAPAKEMARVLAWWRKPSFALASVLSVLVIAVAGIFAYQHIEGPGWTNPVASPTQVALASPTARVTPVTTPESVATGQVSATGPSDVGGTTGPQESPTASAAKSGGEVAAFGPLPEICPLSEVPAYGLGGGPAGSQPATAPEFPFPANLIDNYELEGNLPSDLPGEATAYELKPVADPQAEAEALAAKFGFSGPPEIVEIPPYAGAVPAGDKQYNWHNEKAELDCVASEGTLSYFLASGPEAEGDAVITDEAGATAAARDLLESRGLLSSSMQVESATEVTPPADGQGEGAASPRFWRVHFQKDIGGNAIRGDEADVMVNDTGVVFQLSLTSRDVTGESQYPLRSVEEAWQSVVDGKALWVRMLPFSNAAGDETTATIRGVSVVYYEKLPMQRQDYVQPLYEFSGVVNGPDGQQSPVLIYATAVAPDFLIR